MRYFIILLFLPSWGSAQAQTSGKARNEAIRYYNPTGRTERIDFYDTLSGNLIRSINIEENNPYRNTSYKVLQKPYWAVDFYELPDSAKYNIDYWASDYSKSKNIDSGSRPSYIRTIHTISSATYAQNYIVLGYHLWTYSQLDSLLATHSTYYIYNNKGELYKALEHIPINFNPKYVAISDDGNLICVSGEEYGKDGPQLIRVYEVHNQKYMFSYIFPEVSNQILPVPVYKNMFLIQLESSVNETTFNIFDIANKYIYVKKYDNVFLYNGSRITENGLILKRPDSTFHLEMYTNFPKQKINEK